jgi:signal peptidase I
MKTRTAFIILSSLFAIILTVPLWIASYDIVQGEEQTSMSPLIERGDVLLVVHKWAYQPKIGDIIVYQYTHPLQPELSFQIVHRIFYIEEIEGATHYQVSGDYVDTNSFPDHYITAYGLTWIPETAVKGTVMFIVPKLGLLTQAPVWILAILILVILFPPSFLIPTSLVNKVVTFSKRLKNNLHHKKNLYPIPLMEGLIIVLVISSGLVVSSLVYQKNNQPQIELVNWRVYQTINGTGTVWHFNETYGSQTHHIFSGELFKNWTYVQFAIMNPYPYSFEAYLLLNLSRTSHSCWNYPNGVRLRSIEETTIGFHLDGDYYDLLAYNLSIELISNKGSEIINV